MRNRKGFTLIELLVVILIIGILLALIIPNFVLFQERARRTSVKNNMHVVQTALEAYAVDHYGRYPTTDITWDADDETGMAAYFPGGDPIGVDGSSRAGNFPVNPYTATRYNTGDYTDLDYEVHNGEFDIGMAAATRGDDAVGCPYFDWEGDPEVAGSIFIGTYNNEVTDIPEEYGMAGWGRDNTGYPMYDIAPGADDPTDSDYWVFFVLHT